MLRQPDLVSVADAVVAAEVDVGFVCTQCGSANLAREKVRMVLWDDERPVVVTDVPALVCQACGERAIDDRTAIALDRLRGEGFPEARAIDRIAVPVFSLRGLLVGGEDG